MLPAVLGTLAIVAATAALGWLVARRTRLPPRLDEEAQRAERAERAAPPPPRVEAGATAATAIRASAEQLARLRAGQRCAACRAPMSAEPDDAAQYDGGVLVLLRWRCPRCAARRTLYVRAAA